MKLDISDWPTLAESWPSECSKIILYQHGKSNLFYLLEVNSDKSFSIIDHECNNKYCYENNSLRQCNCDFKVSLSDKWIELP